MSDRKIAGSILLMIACVSAKRNWPAEISVAVPSTVQLLALTVRLVVANTLNCAPGAALKLSAEFSLAARLERNPSRGSA